MYVILFFKCKFNEPQLFSHFLICGLGHYRPWVAEVHCICGKCHIHLFKLQLQLDPHNVPTFFYFFLIFFLKMSLFSDFAA